MQFLIDIALFLFYICAVLLLVTWSWRFWMLYVNQKFIDKWNADSILLEIKLPREIMKSPLAAEMAIGSLLQGGGVSNWYARNYSGGLPATSSLEIASLEGVIHFYVRINKKFKATVEANFYAQYPGIEIVEADDYTKKIRYHHLTKDTNMFGIAYSLGGSWKPTDPKTGKFYQFPDKKTKKVGDYSMKADFLPLKTYVDYELDKDPKEEFKTDPITPLLEFMGGIGKGEYFWYQILINAEGVYDGSKFPKLYLNEASGERISMSGMADLRKKQIRTSGYIVHGDQVMDDWGYEKTRKVEDGVDSDGKPKFKEIPLTHNFPVDKQKEAKALGKKDVDLTIEEKDTIESINKKVSKPLVAGIIRLVYVTKKESFKGGHVQNILGFGRPYANKVGNSLGYAAVSDPYDYDWQKIGGKRVHWRTEEMFESYVEREGFFPHIKERKSLDEWEDMFFYPYSMKARKMYRMIYEIIFFPFEHPTASAVSTYNLEEIATLWHLPGQAAYTPAIPRIDSNKGVAPSNLPQ